MTTLDEPMGFIDPNDVSPRSTAMRHGLIWGLLGILLGLVSYLMGWSDPSGGSSAGGMISGVLSIGLSVTMLVLAIKYHRDKELGGYITFGRGFKTGMLTAFFYAIVATVWTIIFINFIATDMIDLMQASMYEQWEKQGLSEEQIEQAAGFALFFASKKFMIGAAFVGSLIMGAILSSIISAIIKKEQPQTA
jgi:F0F1-type ATP synthase assembly protein I